MMTFKELSRLPGSFIKSVRNAPERRGRNGFKSQTRRSFHSKLWINQPNSTHLKRTPAPQAARAHIMTFNELSRLLGSWVESVCNALERRGHSGFNLTHLKRTPAPSQAARAHIIACKGLNRFPGSWVESVHNAPEGAHAYDWNLTKSNPTQPI